MLLIIIIIVVIIIYVLCKEETDNIIEDVKNLSYDEDGYNQEEYNKNGFDRNGYNSESYDKEGFDAEKYTRHSFGNVYFKLPKGFVYVGLDENGEAMYMDQNSFGQTSCAVIISTCGSDHMNDYAVFEKSLSDISTYLDLVYGAFPNKLTIKSGKGSVIETITNDNIITLWVKAGVCHYFNVSVGGVLNSSKTDSATISMLREFAYAILSTVELDVKGAAWFKSLSKNKD